MSFVEAAQKEGDSFEQGVRIALQAVLVSPQFLFRIERDKDPVDADGRTPDQRVRTRNPPVVFPVEQHAGRRILKVAESGKLRKNAEGTTRADVAESEGSCAVGEFRRAVAAAAQSGRSQAGS